MRLPVELRPPARRWSLRERPPFVEAYPTVSVGAAYRNTGWEYDHLLWRDRHDNIAGAAMVRWPDRSHLAMRFTIQEAVYFEAEAGEVVFDVVWKGSQENNERPFALCPLCRRAVDVLVFAGTWVCASIAHNLRHRSAVIAKEIRWSEALAEVEGRIAAAEMLGLSTKALRLAEEKRDALRAKLGGRLVSANALQQTMIVSEWVQPLGTVVT